MSEDNPLGLDLDAALKRVMSEAFEDEVPDIIRHADFPASWAESKRRLCEELTSGTYSPRHARVVEVPKSSLATRPIALLSIEDRVVFQAVLDHMVETIDAELVEEVYSSRLYEDKKGRMRTKRPIQAWVDFQQAGRHLCDSYGHVCMLTTDITSYFEFIDINTLVDEVRDLHGIDPAHADLLIRLLAGLNSGEVNGVPQGPEVSSFLGNFYLRPLDSQLRKLDVKFIRYQDDIKVFAGETHILRRAVRDLTPIVRRRHLNLSSSKTKVMEGDAVRQHFEDSAKDAISYKLAVEDETVTEDLHELFDNATTADPPLERDIRFAVYRFGKMSDPYAIDWILVNLDSVPYLASILVRYLSAFTPDRPDIFERVRAFLNDPQVNISPIVEMHLVRMIAASDHIDDETYNCVWQILSDPAKETYVRQFASRAVGRHLRDGRSADVELMKGFVDRLATDDELRRALVVGLYEADATSKKYLNDVAKGNPAISHTCRYLRGNPELPPP